MRRISLLALSSLLTLFSFSQSGQWTWVTGNNTTYLNTNNPTYGSMGVPSINNTPGGRESSCSIKDTSGMLWLFGGSGYNSNGTIALQNELWKFNVNTKEWTWVFGSNDGSVRGIYGTNGIAATTNRPGSRTKTLMWIDNQNNIWIFGGYGYGESGGINYLNDLWKYNISSNQWTWVNGDKTTNSIGVFGTLGISSSINKPGGKSSCATWKDNSGNLWLFGGAQYYGGYNNYWNDLWKYNISSNQWTGFGGSQYANPIGIYATLGTANYLNQPGGRNSCSNWVDSIGNLWLFGGMGFAESGSDYGYLNDLWMYNTTINQWTWINGDNALYQSGNYGIRGVEASTNKPGARRESISWVDNAGKVWLFGGFGSDGAGLGSMNDLWKYNPQTNKWVWMDGATTGSQGGVFGIKGTGSLSNKPGSKSAMTSWKDRDGNFWLLGGLGYGAAGEAGGSGYMNDLWKFIPLSSPPTISLFTPTSGVTGTLITITGTGFIGTTLVSVGGIPVSSFTVVSSTTITASVASGASGNVSVANTAGTATLSGFIFRIISKNPAEWVWVSGSNLAFNNGQYGSQGVPDTSNIPGARSLGSAWIGDDSSIYLFGGFGNPKKGPSGIGDLNDLWKYIPSTNNWAWLTGADTLYQKGSYGAIGVTSTNSRPGARKGALSYKDPQNNLWLFGGLSQKGPNFEYYNDLWKYETPTNRWTWINGKNYPNVFGSYGTINIPAASNQPGSRYGSNYWTAKDGTFWLFGGYGYDGVQDNEKLSDMWRYEPSSNYWTFIKGSNRAWLNGSYGNLGVEAPTNNPGGRRYGVSWVDNNGNLFLFGGFGEAENWLNEGYLNDLWKFNYSTKNWTWVNGDSLINIKGRYGIKNTRSSVNKPGGREGAVGWKDTDGNFWLYGGFGFSSIGVAAYLNDLWKYNPIANQWTWVKGDTTYNQFGVYGTIRVSSQSNNPGSRASSIVLTDKSNNFILFGGEGYPVSPGNKGLLNDLWLYSSPITTGCANGSINFESDISGASYQWQLSTDKGVTFNNITNNASYAGTNTPKLSINTASSAYGYQYRCSVNGLNSIIFTLKFNNNWTGAVSSAWSNPSNWSCGIIPDIYTDVIIPANSVVVLSSSTSIATLNLSLGASLTVTTPYALTLFGHQ